LIIQGGKDYRVPVEQGLSAYQAEQMIEIESKLLYFPNENHWVLKPQKCVGMAKRVFSNGSKKHFSCNGHFYN
jgi:dipeptidyl aminopeptidase/acylaminoacyl peptidase